MIQKENCQSKLAQTGPGKPSLHLPFAVICPSPEETKELGRRLSFLLEKGSVVALKGPLGAGKTCFVKGIAKGLGITENVTSPSYAIISEYEGFLNGKTGLEEGDSITLYHIDAYRLDAENDFSLIGGEEIVFGNGISVIEWSERIKSIIPEDAIRVDIEMKDAEKRYIHIYRGTALPDGEPGA